ncbi:MAG: hypothetical protein AAB296_08500, partial [Candidatus Desantisbacteria bacterium]
KVDAVPGFCIDVWDVMERWMPEVIEEASRIKRQEAMEKILTKYTSTVAVSMKQEIVRLFGWERAKDRQLLLFGSSC